MRKKIPIDEEWLNITFQVYDMPEHEGTFKERLKELKRIVKMTRERWLIRRKNYSYPFNKIDCPVVVAKQTVVKDAQHMDKAYQYIIKNGGEGIMLKDPNSQYEGKRSSFLLKYKPNFDAEGIIIGYKPGQGKYQGMLGGFICRQLINHDTYMSIDEDEDHIFATSGMDDSIRSNYRRTHPIGTVITFTYMELSKDGVPRHPVYERIRKKF